MDKVSGTMDRMPQLTERNSSTIIASTMTKLLRKAVSIPATISCCQTTLI